MKLFIDGILENQYKNIQWTWPLLTRDVPPPSFVKRIRILQFHYIHANDEYGWLSKMISVDLLKPPPSFCFDMLVYCENVTVIQCDWMTCVPNVLRGRLKKVSFHKCSQLQDISGLEGVPEVDIHDCHHIVNFSPLGRSHSVSVWECNGFPRDCAVLRGVRHVKLGKLTGLESLDGLQNAETVEIFSCDSIVDPWPLNGVHQVSLITMTLTETLAFLANSSVVNLDNCAVPQGLHGLDTGQGVKYLHIYDCFVPGFGLQTINRMPHCSHLSICDQPYITDISQFTSLEYLELSNCINLTNVPSDLESIAQVSIRGCPFIPDVPCIPEVACTLHTPRNTSEEER